MNTSSYLPGYASSRLLKAHEQIHCTPPRSVVAYANPILENDSKAEHAKALAN